MPAEPDATRATELAEIADLLERFVQPGAGLNRMWERRCRDRAKKSYHAEQARGFERVAALLRRLAAAPDGDRARLDWWEAHLNYEHGTDYEEGDVILYRVTGNVNDREWHEVARGETLREVLDGAMLAALEVPRG